MKKIYLLGATGSIGQQTIEIIRANPYDFVLAGISGFNNFELVKKLAKEFEPEIVAVKTVEEAQILMSEFRNMRVVYGEKGLEDLAGYHPYHDIVLVNALVGMVGLKPTLKAIETNRTILLANKETLVVGGHLIREKLKTSRAKIYPIDSEHNALWQALYGEYINAFKRLNITASGGAFRYKSRS
jgi:1-deoxy-D-xylulose-5-phosphate reductoisomerase